jgi:hypothetical protein
MPYQQHERTKTFNEYPERLVGKSIAETPYSPSEKALNDEPR